MNRFMLFLTCCTFLILQSCSDKLTHSKAEKIITEKIHYPITEDIAVKYGFVGYEKDSLPNFYYVLQRKGIFNIEKLGKAGGIFFINYFRVTLTAEGRKLITVPDPHPIKKAGSPDSIFNSQFKTCDVNFESVQTIHEYPALNGADVQYTVKRSNFTPFWSIYLEPGRRMPDTIQNKTFGVMKNDNGWGPAHF